MNASKAKRQGANNEKAKLLSNKTHYSPRDPDARISIKPGKARKLNYHCSMSVDAANGVISHIQADFAERAYLRQQTTAGKRMKGLRQGTVEPVFGSLTQYYGLNKIPVLGIEGAHKTMLMSAIAFNIKKYMKCHPKKVAESALHKVKDYLSEQLERFTCLLGVESGFSFR